MTDEDIKKFDFLTVFTIADLLVAEKFEGDPERYNFTKEEWYQIEIM